MTSLEIVLLILSVLLLVLYVSSKMGKDQSLNEVIKEVKDDLRNTAENVSSLVNKAKDIVLMKVFKRQLKNSS